MSLSVSANYTYQSATALSASTARGMESSAGGSSSTQIVGNDSVSLSKAGLALSSIILPTEENVRKLTDDLSKKLGGFLARAGVSAKPPIEFSVGSDGQLEIEGNRADKQKILDLINGDKDMSDQVRTAAAISSQAVAMEKALKVELEYMASSDPKSVVAKYSSIFSSGGQSSDVSLTFDGKSVQVLSDGKPWPASGV